MQDTKTTWIGNPAAGNVPSGGIVYWITGLSGAGKTTLAAALTQKLQLGKNKVVHFDGDQLRAIFRMTDVHDPAARLDLAFRYARLCQTVAVQGVDVVCSTISLFPEIHQWNRENNPRYAEIYLKVSMDVLKARDDKFIYARAMTGEISNVVGIDIPLVEPAAPDLIIENDGRYRPEQAAELILRHFTAEQARDNPRSARLSGAQ
ncbi:MAG: adenylyl-sulfate kinase [Rhodospirillaceae bacterium]|jgi:cytidine diphosphoramidate kinase|nr:adenylyl-sulfate kinase [Rhodospirillaceae bacterium]MBT4489323.1 adenylyl-sulfate kinase [Rhodospirillaceae bacterium]MBT5048781.1 adenylyl-sulfate kinase [Rhodospirillaceae bacterium]MBT5895811.1 adenylyl-sulfate kinase [Rhodospirillaceae bacterium]MBT7757915.1 adenylyl-sulfate kinase [Rhodospirillaceae bacterium]